MLEGEEMRILRTVAFLLLTLSLLPASLPVSAADADLEKEFKRDIALYRIRPDSSRSLRKDADGTPVSESRFRQSVESFYRRLYPLSPAFLKRLKIKSVVFKDTLYNRDGDVVQRAIVGDDLFMDADLVDELFYTSLFYLQFRFMSGGAVSKWEKLNPDGFVYEEKRGNVTGHAKQKLDAVLAEWDQYFVSRTGMYSPEMDMALTFVYLLAKGPASVTLTSGERPVIQKKAQLLSEQLVSLKAFDPGYLDTLLAVDLAKLKKYSPEALSVRLFMEFTGAWTVPPSEDGTPAPVRKPDDDVEVAGQKIKPLILALTVNDFRLFRQLVGSGADPNVSSKDGLNALRLAIRNNDPEEVKLLLDAGAKVSQETARAGTASGIHADIVKLMAAYLPGGKQADASGAKRKPQAAGSGERRP